MMTKDDHHLKYTRSTSQIFVVRDTPRKRSFLCVNHQEILTNVKNVRVPLRRSDQSNQLRVLGVNGRPYKEVVCEISYHFRICDR
jgi:hypothetical protein